LSADDSKDSPLPQVTPPPTGPDAGPDLPDACRRFARAAAAAGLPVAIVVHAQLTRTAQEAAEACGCGVGQIVKSLVFRTRGAARPVLLLVSGANRVDENRVAALLGEPVERPDAAWVREVAGFAIGGIPPLGHARPLETWMDEDLFSHSTVFAAAGTGNAVFPVAPLDLLAAAKARRARLA
jgi:prolyl-tRNA editing enzyme YbaK/EbsC (Cys-tRNA(Pro) deacylase)